MFGPAVSITQLIGGTPLLQLPRLSAHLPADIKVSVKAEWYNPGGSVKDRAAWNIVRTAMQQGHLLPGGTLLDASSGNTGIAYAMLGAALGFRVKLCLPASANAERQQTLRIYGVNIVLTSPLEGSDGAIAQARALAADPNLFYADQYSNPANWQAHYATTGPELWQQTQASLSHFVVGLGTTGTCVGVSRYLRKYAPQARVLALQPSGPLHGLEGLKHLASAMVPGIYDPAAPHEQVTCDTEDAYAMARRLAQTEGLLVGISAAAAVHVALKTAESLAQAGASGHVVALAPDGGNRYLSEAFWKEA